MLRCSTRLLNRLEMKVAALIVAAGQGGRAGGGIPKQYRLLGGLPAVAWSVRSFACAKADKILAVIDPDHAELFQNALRGGPAAAWVAGGTTRTQSVRAGLLALSAEPPDIVLIHDAARPGLPPELVTRLIREMETGAEAVAPALPAADSLRRTDRDGFVIEDVSRAGLWRIQTPQTFRYAAIAAAYERAPADAAFDDDFAVARAAGIATRLVPGDRKLDKLTYPEDFDMLERILGAPRAVCVGTGFDAHRFGAGDHVTLCGVKIAHDKGLLGHSDADAGWHALVDAILGALGAGDIGDHFPPSDPNWRGAPSQLFLDHAARLTAAAGARIVNVDVTLLCERPKIAPHRQAMRARTAEVLGIPIDRVSIKATTTERLGFLGREEGLAAQAAASVERPV